MTELAIRGGTLVTVGALGVVEADLAVDGGRIVAIQHDVGQADEEIDARGTFVIPGFVQAHVHLCQTLFRGLADDMDVVEWLRKRIWPLEQAHNKDTMRAACLLGVAELLTSATTTVLSMESIHHTDESFRAAEELGIRAVIGKALMDRVEPGTAMVGESTHDAYKSLLALVETWHNAADGRLQVAVSPRSPRNASPDLWRQCVQMATEADLRLHTHVNENEAQSQRVAQAEGRDVVALHEWGALSPRLVMAHCVWLDKHERDLLRGRRPHVCHCPSANLKLASGIAPIPEYLADGLNVALGADGAACNNRLDAFSEMRLAALVHKPRYGPRSMPAATVLEMATLGGARALGLEQDIGSLEVGKRADIALIRRGRLHAVPTNGTGAAEQLVYSHCATDVEAVVVGGKRVVGDGRLLSADSQAIAQLADTARLHLLGRINFA